MKNETVKSVVVLTSVCLVVALLMACVYAVTGPIIKENNEKAAKEALYKVLENATEFTPVECDGAPSSVTNIYIDNSGSGYAFILQKQGFGSSPLRIAVGIDVGGKIVKVYTIDCSSESPGYGSKVGEDWFMSRFNGISNDTISGVDTISGATVSSSAYKSAIADALSAFDMITKNAKASSGEDGK